MVIFRGLEDDEGVLARLSDWMPVTMQSSVARKSYAVMNWALYFGVGAAMTVVFTVKNTRAFLLLGLPLAGILCWSMWALLNSRTVDRRTRSTAWWVLLPLAALVYKGWILLDH